MPNNSSSSLPLKLEVHDVETFADEVLNEAKRYVAHHGGHMVGGIVGRWKRACPEEDDRELLRRYAMLIGPVAMHCFEVWCFSFFVYILIVCRALPPVSCVAIPIIALIDLYFGFVSAQLLDRVCVFLSVYKNDNPTLSRQDVDQEKLAYCRLQASEFW